MVRKINQRRLPDLRACLCEREQIGGGLIIWAGPISTVPPLYPLPPPMPHPPGRAVAPPFAAVRLTPTLAAPCLSLSILET